MDVWVGVGLEGGCHWLSREVPGGDMVVYIFKREIGSDEGYKFLEMDVCY